MPHPFFDALTFAWHHPHAVPAQRALLAAYPQFDSIDTLYRRCAAGLPPLSMYGRPDALWKDALEALVAAGVLRRLCEFVLEDPAAAAAHGAIRRLVDATHDHQRELTADVQGPNHLLLVNLLGHIVQTVCHESRLVRVRSLWNQDESSFELIPTLLRDALLTDWSGGDFIMPTPQGLASVPSPLVHSFTERCDRVLRTLASLDRECHDSHWSLQYVADRCALSIPETGIALLYVRFVAEGCVLIGADEDTGLPRFAALSFAIRRPRQTLTSYVGLLERGGVP